MSQINLVPFYFGKYGLTPASFLGIVNNIILTMPFGFGLNFIARVKTKKITFLAFALGVGLETAQLIFSIILGYPYRTIDINDAIFNATGVLLGYAFFKVFALLYLAATKKFALKHENVAAYIYDIANQAQITDKVKNPNQEIPTHSL